MSTPIESTSEQVIRWPQLPSIASRQTIDVPTIVLAAVILGGYGFLTWYFRDMPLWVAGPLGAIWLTWYGSLQHETIHNHPTSSRRSTRGWPACRWRCGFPIACIA